MTSRGRLLLVEDDVDIRETLAEVFEEEGYEVARAANGREALVELGSRPLPAVILLDLMMPVMDGWQLHAELQKVVELATIPLIVLSADGQVEQTACFRGAGHLRKPPDVVELLEMVERLCVLV
jgi:CheY-like chemotaxis protein